MQGKNTVLRICQECGAEFYVLPFRVAQGGGKHCSRDCRDAARRGKPGQTLNLQANALCEVCHKEFRVSPSVVVAGGARFCSNECRWHGDQVPIIIPEDERDLIYMAGIVDGEGTITALRNLNPKTGTRGVSCRVMVANSSVPLMDWIGATFGGRVSLPRKTRKPNHKPIRTWYAGSDQAVALCLRLLPYLKVKGRQAEIVIALHDLPYTKGGIVGRHVSEETWAARNPLLDEMHDLNHRGLVLTE